MTSTIRRPIARATFVLVVVGAVLGALAGCGGSSGDSAASAASVSPSVAPVTCPSPATVTTKPGEQQTIQSSGGTRTYNVWLPKGYDGTKPVPVLVDFHGTSGQSTSYVTGFSAMAAKAPARGYLLVAPQAIKGDATALRWRVPGTGEAPSDVTFTSDILRAVQQKYCVDPERFYASGFSSGGAFTTYVSCQLDAWGAVAPMSGVSLVQPCTTRPPVAMITFHGTNDLFVPFQGLPGADSTANPDGYYEGKVEFAVAQWAVRNGCSATYTDVIVPPVGTTSGPGSKITKRTYSGCKAGDDVVFYILDGTGHAYPGGPRLGEQAASELGGQSTSIDAATVLLDYFDAHKRSTPPNLTPVPEILAGSTAAPASLAPTTAATGGGVPTSAPGGAVVPFATLTAAP